MQSTDFLPVIPNRIQIIAVAHLWGRDEPITASYIFDPVKPVSIYRDLMILVLDCIQTAGERLAQQDNDPANLVEFICLVFGPGGGDAVLITSIQDKRFLASFFPQNLQP